MGFYDLSKEERDILVDKMQKEIETETKKDEFSKFLDYASNNDTYIRKKAYLIMARFFRDRLNYRDNVIHIINHLFDHDNELVRQTMVNTLGEIGKTNAEIVFDLLEAAMEDEHFKVRNAVMSSLKKMSKKNPEPTLAFAKQFLDHPDPRIRRQVVHGIELRGRIHPEDVLPLLKEVQFETNKKVRETLIHVLGQISYKDGCLPKVLRDLKTWNNESLIKEALNEIVSVHKNYDFSKYTNKEVQKLVENQFS
ncbi:MAG: HEAT repeat domain-containing protein [Candidatus Lokiarchaeota archaeon]|nr:HEAT repeat domain-containing protein [Candidatus Lokiarchaeota archaeon]MBD3202143.1 HEAT repeat domain-containing protein [Candidatus Lokiarchaeota archaeon]